MYFYHFEDILTEFFILGYPGEGPRKCIICQKYIKHGAMKQHMKEQHKCSTCGVSFSTALQYNRHQHRHQHKCTICQKYVAHGSMKEHIKVNNKYKCNYCDGYTSYGRKCSCRKCQFCHEWFQHKYLLAHLKEKHTCGDKTTKKIQNQRGKINRMERRRDPWHHYDKVNSVFQILIVRMKTFM